MSMILKTGSVKGLSLTSLSSEKRFKDTLRRNWSLKQKKINDKVRLLSFPQPGSAESTLLCQY